MGRLSFVAPCVLLLLFAIAAPGHASEAPQVHTILDCRPERLQSLLAGADSCIIGKACGRISRPWLYRGPRGDANRMRAYGVRTVGPEATHALADLMLRNAAIDSAMKVRSVDISCETGDSTPVYTATFLHGDSLAYAVLRFDTGQVLFFTKDVPLGFVAMGANADSLWSRLAATLDWNADLAGPRPVVLNPADPALPRQFQGDYLFVEDLPEPLVKVPPTYPEAAREAGVSGLVMTQVFLGQQGEVKDAVAVYGPPMLRDAALDAVWQWTFKPARSKGKPVAVWVAIPIKFSLH
jgi:TonB family protein